MNFSSGMSEVAEWRDWPRPSSWTGFRVWKIAVADEISIIRSHAVSKSCAEEVRLRHPRQTDSGWGDGVYPVIGSYDDSGRLLAAHVDFLVIP